MAKGLVAAETLVIDSAGFRREPGDPVSEAELLEAGQTKDDVDSLLARGCIMTAVEWADRNGGDA